MAFGFSLFKEVDVFNKRLFKVLVDVLFRAYVVEEEDLSQVWLKDVRDGFNAGSVDLNEIPALFGSWKNQDLYSVFAYPDYKRPAGLDGRCQLPSYECNFVARKLMKRGNDVYCRYVRKRLEDVYDTCKTARKFDLSKGSCEFDSHVLLISLTYDVNKCGLQEAHKNFGREFNAFIQLLKQDYPDLQFFRVFETSNRFHYPHAHVVCVFPLSSFHSRLLKAHKVKGKWVKSRFIVNDDTKGRISSFWHSFVDIRAVNSVEGVWYCLKYLNKDFQNCNRSSTPAFNWLFGRRSYDVSKGFMDCLKYVLFQSGGWVSPLEFSFKPLWSDSGLFVGCCGCEQGYGDFSFKVKPPPVDMYTDKGRFISPDFKVVRDFGHVTN